MMTDHKAPPPSRFAGSEADKLKPESAPVSEGDRFRRDLTQFVAHVDGRIRAALPPGVSDA